jgi:hypothetical protein
MLMLSAEKHSLWEWEHLVNILKYMNNLFYDGFGSPLYPKVEVRGIAKV